MRIRLIFEERRLLTKEQRFSGLQRCWFLIRPEIATVADLAADLSRRFHLKRSCPSGIFFSMDDFVIPPSESTCFFREKDVVRVHKRTSKKKMIKRCDDVQLFNGAETEEETVPPSNEILAIESREMVQIRNSQVTTEGNSSLRTQSAEVGSKRKHKEMEKPESSKKKKKPKLTNINKSLVVNGSSCKRAQEEPNQPSLQRTSTSEQVLLEKANPSDVHEASPMAAVATENADVSNKTSQTISEMNKQLEDDCNADTCEPNSGVPTKKFPSRSARRRYVQRHLKKEKKKQAAENVESVVLPNGTDEPAPANRVTAVKQAAENVESVVLPNGTNEPAPANRVAAVQEEPTETQNFVVARVVRPGYIRFESEGEDDDGGGGTVPNNTQRNEQPVESFQWNGITNKAKGQKWGQGFKHRNSANGYNSASSNWRENNFTNEMAIEKSTFDIGKANIVQLDSESLSPLTRSLEHGNNANGNKSTSSNWGAANNENNFSNEMAIEISISDIGKATKDQLNFESLSPLTRSPKEGDLVVYRVVELSSSWCPDLSPFRVGEVKVYDPISRRVILAPVPKYPIFPDTEEDDTDKGEDALCQDCCSLYKEDGSLEIDFSSLVDVRLLRDNGLVSPSASSVSRKRNSSQTAMGKDKYLANSWEIAAATCSADDLVNPTSRVGSQDNPSLNNSWDIAVQNDAEEAMLNPTGAEPNSNWEEANGEVTNAGHTGDQQNGWDTWAPNTSTPSWSYRALRGSALGPTIAWLRGNNGDGTRGDRNAIRGNGRGRGRGRRGGRRGRGRGNQS